MSLRKIVIELTFEDVVYDEDDIELTLIAMERVHSDLKDQELDSLGESIAQTDKWQLDRWNDLQQILGSSSTRKISYK